VIHELLFRVETDQGRFWVGAAVPAGTTDFSRAQVFFHPTVIQAGDVIAADADYPEFKGGWSGSLQRYVPMQGCQLAGAGRLLPLLVPFTTMAALGNSASNMFSSHPVEVLNAVIAAIPDAIGVHGLPAPELAAIGVSSFSSGITAMRLFLQALVSSGLIKEITDFDSPFIVSEPKALTTLPGAVSRCYTQVAISNPPSGWLTLSPSSFSQITAFTTPHAIIGFMAYYSAMLTSAIV
jgi:hypothetical protein